MEEVEACEIDAHHQIENFERELNFKAKSMLKSQITKGEFQSWLDSKLKEKFESAGKYEKDHSENHVKVVEEYFVILGMLKIVIESDHFDVQEDQHFLQHLLLTYDLVSSLKLCRLYSLTKSYDQVMKLTERILSMDPAN